MEAATQLDSTPDQIAIPVPVTTMGELESLCRGWRRAAALAVDTEFVRTSTFYARIGLIQVCDGETSALLDPIELPDLQPFAEVLTCPSVRKVFYSCTEDIEVLHRVCHVVPVNLFDAQIAASILGYETLGGYQGLLRGLLGIEIPKHETRTNWCRRPLSPDQLRYAVEDVAHLLPVYELLLGRLRAEGREDWAMEECAALLDPARFDPPPGEYYLRLPSATYMKPRQLAALRALCAWREEQARRRDRPRSYVAKDGVLVAMARRNPRTIEEILTLPDVPRREVQRSGRHWLEILRSAEETAEADLPLDLRHRRRTPIVERFVKELRERNQHVATALHMQADFVAPRRLLEEVAIRLLQGEEPATVASGMGWRGALMDPAWLSTAAEGLHAAPSET